MRGEMALGRVLSGIWAGLINGGEKDGSAGVGMFQTNGAIYAKRALESVRVGEGSVGREEKARCQTVKDNAG